MKSLNIMFISATFLIAMMASQLTYASNAVPSHMIETIYPPFRTGDMHSYDGEATVRVTKITGINSNGEKVTLFNDRLGALIPLVELENIKILINPLRIKEEGEYDNLNVYLADEILSISNKRIDRTPLQPSLGGTVVSLRGRVHIGKYEVTTNGLSF